MHVRHGVIKTTHGSAPLWQTWSWLDMLPETREQHVMTSLHTTRRWHTHVILVAIVDLRVAEIRNQDHLDRRSVSGLWCGQEAVYF